MHLLIVDHSPGVLLEHDVSALDEAQKSAIDMHPFSLVLDRLLQNLIDVVPMGFQELTDFQRGMAAKGGDVFASLCGVAHRFIRLLAHPGDDRDPSVPKD